MIKQFIKEQSYILTYLQNKVFSYTYFGSLIIREDTCYK